MFDVANEIVWTQLPPGPRINVGPGVFVSIIIVPSVDTASFAQSH